MSYLQRTVNEKSNRVESIKARERTTLFCQRRSKNPSISARSGLSEELLKENGQPTEEDGDRKGRRVPKVKGADYRTIGTDD